MTGLQVRDEQAPDTQAPAAEVQHAMVLAESEKCRQQVERKCRDQIIAIGRADIRAVMPITRA